MKKANISYTKNNLSSLLNYVREGESVLIMDRDKAIARIEPVGDMETEGVPVWVREQIQRGVLVPGRKRMDPRKLARMPMGRVTKRGDIVRALIEDREDRV